MKKFLKKINQKLLSASKNDESITLSRIELELLIQQAENAQMYEKALNDICYTSGKGMFHSFSERGHQEAVVIAEKVLDEHEF